MSLTVDSSIEDVTEEEIHTVMSFIIERDIFSPDGNNLEELLEAKVVETNTTLHDLVL